MENLKQLVADGLLRNAIDEASKLTAKGTSASNDLILLSGQLASLDRENNIGIIGGQDYTVGKNRISRAFLNLIAELKAIDVTPSSNDVKTVLMITANPNNLPELSLPREFQNIYSKLQDGGFKVKTFDLVTFDILRATLLREKPEIIHFACHGDDQTGGIILQNQDGSANIVSIESLTELFYILNRDNSMDLVFFNACYSNKQAKDLSRLGFHVIGMKDSIGDKSAIQFSTVFYESMAYGANYRDAFDLGINSLFQNRSAFTSIPYLYHNGDLLSNDEILA